MASNKEFGGWWHWLHWILCELHHKRVKLILDFKVQREEFAVGHFACSTAGIWNTQDPHLETGLDFQERHNKLFNLLFHFLCNITEISWRDTYWLSHTLLRRAYDLFINYVVTHTNNKKGWLTSIHCDHPLQRGRQNGLWPVDILFVSYSFVLSHWQKKEVKSWNVLSNNFEITLQQSSVPGAWRGFMKAFD